MSFLSPEPAVVVPWGKEQAKAGFAILRNAGITVKGMAELDEERKLAGTSRMDPSTTKNLTDAQKKIIERRMKQLNAWLVEAEQELVK